MKPLRMLVILAICAAILAVAAFYASRKKIKFATNPPPEKVVVINTNFPPATSPTSSAPTPEPTACHQMPEYYQLRLQLGRLVNSDKLRTDPKEFLKSIEEFRGQYGLPFPLNTLPTNKLESEGVVYNNCHPTCKGAVNQVFVSRILKNSLVEVYTKSGKLKALPLHDSGLDVATVDELNRKGVPFKSWKVPAVETQWSISGNFLYYAMDIEGLWLQIDTHGNWKIVTHPQNLERLEGAEPAAKVAGCVDDEECLESVTTHRHFKAPKACEPILKHQADEPVDHSQDASPAPGQ